MPREFSAEMKARKAKSAKAKKGVARKRMRPARKPTSAAEAARKRRFLQDEAGRLLAASAGDFGRISPARLREVVQGIQDRRIELELQNEELRYLQRDLEQARDRYADLYEFAPVGYMTIDAGQVVTQANLTMAAMLKRDRHSILGRRLSYFAVPEDRDACYIHARSVLTSGRAAECELRLSRGDGTVFYADLHTVAVVGKLARSLQREGSRIGGYVPPGHSLGCQLIISDITLRKEAEQRLAKSQQQVQIATAAAGAGRWTLDLAAQVAILDARARKIWGLAPDEPATMERLEDCLHPDDVEVFAAAVRQSTAEGKEFLLEIRLREGGRWLSLVGSVVGGAGGAPSAMTGLVTDITDRRLAEQILRDSKDALDQQVRQRTTELRSTVNVLQEEVSRRMDTEMALRRRSEQLRALASELTLAEQRERRRLAEVLHDDLQQVLASAKMQSVSLRGQAKRLADGGKLGRAEESGIQQSIDRLVAMLDSSLNISKTLTAELSPAVLHNAELPSIMGYLARQMKEKHDLEVKLEITPDLPPVGEHLRVLLFQVARELLFNIAKHAGVKTAQMKVATRPRGKLAVEISDEGQGFDPQKARERTGTKGGFGLLNVSERVEVAGGKLEIDSAPGRGSRFTILLPLTAAAGTKALKPALAALVQKKPAGASGKVSRTGKTRAAMRAAPGAATDSPEKIRVLLADNHLMFRQGLAGLLSESRDMEIVGQAADGQEAVELTERLNPDVVLMDVNMPHLDGVAATRIIHATHPHICIIGLSGFDDPEFADRMTAAGAVTYLSKNDSPSAILAAIRSCALGLADDPKVSCPLP